MQIEALNTMAGIHPLFLDTFHRLLSRRFPYAVYYLVEGDDVVIHAVLDCRSDPDKVTNRLV